MNERLSNGELIGGRYQIVGFVGEGGMQHVYKATDTLLSRIVALKTPKNSSAATRFLRSAVVSAKINHPNVAKTLDYVLSGDRQFLIEEFIDGADLDKALLMNSKFLDPYLAAKIFHHLAKGLSASHRAGVIHRDLKPTNIMVSGGFDVSAIKITDFGIARMAQVEIEEAVENQAQGTLTNSSTAMGALPYMAPEAIQTPQTVGKPADVWALGAMMYELMTGVKPFGNGLRAVANIVSAKMTPFPDFLTTHVQFRALSQQLIALVVACLTADPDQRPTADELVASCGDLYYQVATRYIGTVTEIRHNAFGFIRTDVGSVFFHKRCVYGERLKEGDVVMLAKFNGRGSDRAYPVVKIVTS